MRTMMMRRRSIDGVYYSTKKKNNTKNKKTSVSSRTATRILERLFFALEKERRSTFSSCR